MLGFYHPRKSNHEQILACMLHLLHLHLLHLHLISVVSMFVWKVFKNCSEDLHALASGLRSFCVGIHAYIISVYIA